MGLTFDAVLVPPAATDGVPTGQTGWRFAVQVLVASGGARVGQCHVDSARVSGLTWYDITADVNSIEWTRGSQAAAGRGYPRANVGVATIGISNASRFYSPWNSAQGNVTVGSTINTNYLFREWRPGCIIRCVFFKATASTTSSTAANGFTTITRTDWYPRFTGVVESWDETEEIGSNTITVTAIETLSTLAQIQKTAVTPVGANDTLIQRLKRLLDDAGWPYPIVMGNSPNYFDDVVGGYFLLQATTMSANRLAELYLSADSIEATELFSDVDGSLKVGYGNTYTWTGSVPSYSAPIVRFTNNAAAITGDSTNYPLMQTALYSGPLVITNNSDFVLNDVSFTRVGGAEQRITTPESIGIYGRQTYVRTDLICTNDVVVGYAADFVRRQWDYYDSLGFFSSIDQTMQPGRVAITEQHDAQRTMNLGDVSVLDWIDPTTSLGTRFLGRITWLHEIIVPTPGALIWSTEAAIVSNYVNKL